MRKPPPPVEDWEVLSIAKVIDGDTADLSVRREVGKVDQFTIWAEGVIRLRVVHLDTPERDDQPGYDQATDDAARWLHDEIQYDDLRVTTQGKDAFGRYLGDVYLADDRAVTLSDWMVRVKNWPVWTG